MTRRQLIGVIVGLSLGLACVVLVGGSLIDGAAAKGKSRRNVEVAGIEIGGRSRSEVTQAVQALNTSLRATPISITAGSVSAATTAGDLGMAIDVEATVAAIMNVRDPAPLVGWVFDLGKSSTVDVVVTVDDDLARATVTELNQNVNDAPIEPTVTLSNGELVAVPGRTGAGIAVDAVIAELRRRTFEQGLIALEVPEAQISPAHDVKEVDALVADMNAMTAQPLTLVAGGATADIEVPVLRGWLTTTITPDDEVTFSIDADVVSADLLTRLSAGNLAPTDAYLDVIADVPQIIPATVGQVCCAPEAPAVILEALKARLTAPVPAPVTVPMIETAPGKSTADITALGIKELVSTFKTPHKSEPDPSRVTNIHLAADTLKGKILAPGEKFSLNEFLGKRTADKGYVMGGTLQDGVLVPAIGGGVSQVATTLFNAALGAGLQINDHQSHSVYISRYPRGLDATVDFPSIDLIFTNITPHSVLIWPTYTDTEVTVSMYSTKWVTVTQGAQTKRTVGAVCTAYTTEIINTYLDGTTKTVNVKAQYRPEGKVCDGTPSVTTTTVPTTTVPTSATTKAVTTTTATTTPGP